MRKIARRWWWVLPLVLIVTLGGFVVWASRPLSPMPEALAALQSDAAVDVTSDNGWYVFRPTGVEPTTGFIFYPGGRVDSRAYAPIMRQIAAQGYLTVIVPMPLNLAIFNLNAAESVMKAYPDIEHWAIGGHSLGGSMAARFVQSNPVAVEGLVFWASYPDIDLSGSGLDVVSVYGTLDAVAQGERIESSRELLPPDTAFVPVEGGNHSQFGWYGLQAGDNEATVSRDNQQTQVVDATITVLTQISGE